MHLRPHWHLFQLHVKLRGQCIIAARPENPEKLLAGQSINKVMLDEIQINSVFTSELRSVSDRHTETAQTRCPKLDPVFKSSSGKIKTKTAEAKEACGTPALSIGEVPS